MSALVSRRTAGVHISEVSFVFGGAVAGHEVVLALPTLETRRRSPARGWTLNWDVWRRYLLFRSVTLRGAVHHTAFRIRRDFFETSSDWCFDIFAFHYLSQ